jgi:hypothetical protein
LNTPPDVFLKRDFVPRRDAFNEHNVLQERKMEAEHHRDALQTKLKKFLAAKVQSFKGEMGGDEDTLLYRVQVKRSTPATSSTPLRRSNKPSACEWHPLGYRCSERGNPKPHEWSCSADIYDFCTREPSAFDGILE